MVRGEGLVPGSGFQVIQVELVKPLGSFSVSDLRCKILFTLESANVVLGSGFKVKVSGAQKSRLGFGFGATTEEK